MFTTLPLSILIILFIFSAIIVWIAGIKLSFTTDIIDSRFGIGEALGGLIFLAITTNLPEIAIVISAAYANEIEIAIGNILGGIAIQTVVLVILDGFGLRHKAALSYQAASLQLVLEGTLVIIILSLAIMGTQLPSSVIFKRIVPNDLLILVTWLIGIWLINKARHNLPWHKQGKPPQIVKLQKISRQAGMEQWKTFYVILMFLLAATLTLVAGFILERTGSAIAHQIGWNGVLFGSTILAAVTALPEISTGLAAIKIGDYTLAVSDIFGGNAFLPVLFLPATLLAGQSTLSLAHHSDIYLACLGILLTAIYIYGLIFRSKHQFCYLGIDSIIVLLVYIIGIAGLFFIAR